MLATIVITVQKLGHNFVKPSLYFNPIAHAISSRPARKRMNQFIAPDDPDTAMR
jgi:hypothetical protein